MYYKITKHSELLDMIGAGYQKNKVPLRELSQFLNMPKLMLYDEEDAIWWKALAYDAPEPDEIGIFMLEFSVLISAEDTFTYEADPFILKTSNSTGVEYRGPIHIVYNSTANCTRGVRQPKGRYSTEWCDTPNYSDSRLTLWNVTEQEIEPIQLKKSLTQNRLYCPDLNITIDDQEWTCPAWPIKLDASRKITLNNKTLHFEVVDNVSVSRHKSVDLPIQTLNESLDFDPVYENSMTQIRKITQLRK